MDARVNRVRGAQMVTMKNDAGERKILVVDDGKVRQSQGYSISMVVDVIRN
jgi:hypothetical protein